MLAVEIKAFAPLTIASCDISDIALRLKAGSQYDARLSFRCVSFCSLPLVSSICEHPLSYETEKTVE